jgi:hypothetical protein
MVTKTCLVLLGFVAAEVLFASPWLVLTGLPALVVLLTWRDRGPAAGR